jgi:restriction endonuclease Mrr
MSLSLKETQAISEIAELLYSFLPGSPHPYATPAISFPGVASKLGLSKYWKGGSKKPAIIQLLQATLEYRRDKFCTLMVEIVRTGIAYRSNKGEPITRDEIVTLNQLVARVNFKVPELWDSGFLDTLPSSHKVEKQEQNQSNQEVIEKLKNDLIKLTSLKPQERGFAFEKFLNELFGAYNLDPRSSFRMTGEQIDGSFQLGSDVYLVEAKWQDKQIDQSELLVFHGKVGGKSSWSRGLFVSHSGFTPDGLTAFSRGRSTNMIGMDSQDLFHILNGEMLLVEAINKKARRAAETGDFFVSVFSLSKGG